ncbi:MAG: DUF3256 family protein [Bacteroidetes bacterium]|nr:DUF3256 family protein [Bacteroidota bacterium]
MIRNIIIGIGLVILSFDLNAQKISDIFLLMPDSLVDNLSFNDRTKILTKGKLYPSTNNAQSIEVYTLEQQDTIKNYLRIELSYESGQAAYVIFEIRSFNTSKGDKVIVFSNVGGAHNDYNQNELVFFDFKKGKLQVSRTDYLPRTIGLKDFIKFNTPDSLREKYDEYSCSSYELGYDGNNITYRLNDNYLFDNEFDSSYILGNSIEFRWNGNRFERQNVIKKE